MGRSMATQYTGLLGTIDSTLGNLVLGNSEGTTSGGGGPSIYTHVLNQSLTPTQLLFIRFTNGTIFNNLIINQSVIYQNNTKLINQTIPISQSVIANTIRDQIISQTLIINQLIARVYFQTISSTLIPTQTAAFLKYKVVLPNNILVINQTAIVAVQKNRTVINTLVINQSLTKTKVNNIIASNTLVPIQNVIVKVTKNASNNLIINHTASILVSKHIVSNLGDSLQQFITIAKILNRQTLSYTVMFQRLLMIKVARRNLENNLIVNQTVVVSRVKAASNTLVINQTVTGTVSKATSNGLYFQQLAVASFILNRSLSQNLAPRQLIAFYKIYNRSISHTLGINQTVTIKRARQLTASNTLVLGQELVHSRYFQLVTNTINISQTVVLVKNRILIAKNTIPISQSVKRNVIINHTVSNTLVFNHRRTITDGENEIFVSEVQIYTVTDYVQLRSGYKSLILPNPEFNDNQGVKTALQVKQAIGGKKYALVKNNNRTKLDYTFLIDNDDRDNLEEFIYSNYDKYFWLTTFRGEQYYVTLVTNPIEYVQLSDNNCGKVSVDLSFEGVLTN